MEYTGGTTGVSLAFVSAIKGFKIRIVFSDAFSEDKGLMMKALGVEITMVPRLNRGISENVIKEMIETAIRLSQEPGHWWSDQLNNKDAIRGYAPLGEELWEQTNGNLNAFVQVVGTAHSINGTGAALRQHDRSIKVVAVEPAESAVLSGLPSGAHNIDGIGIGFIPSSMGT